MHVRSFTEWILLRQTETGCENGKKHSFVSAWVGVWDVRGSWSFADPDIRGSGKRLRAVKAHESSVMKRPG